MRIWFHGTSAEKAAVIMKAGFKPRTYFARALEDALEFGGMFVFFVALEHEPAIDGNWQMCVSNAVPADAILSVKRYDIVNLEDYPERRAEAFAADCT